MLKHTINYSFKCERCGTHSVDEKTFDAHITPHAREKIATSVDVTKARLVFHDGCPVCLTQQMMHTRIADVEIMSKKP